jgi:selenocysteine lyase/cysteine desulfurase
MSDPLPAVERAMSAFKRSVRGHPVGAYDKCRAVLNDFRSVAAEVFGGAGDSWAIANGHTSTIDLVASSVAEFLGATRARPITVVTTDSEHVGGIGAFTADPRFTVRFVSVDDLPKARGCVFFLSHLTYLTNRDLTAEITAVSHRAPGSAMGTWDSPIVLVDGTQAVGQIDVDVEALGCHAYLASAHKWLGGPHGSGILYLRADVIERWPTPYRAGEPLCVDRPIGRWEPRGGQDFSRVAGIMAAIRAYQCHASPGTAIREDFVRRLGATFGDQVSVLHSSAPHGRVIALALPGHDVYPVYRDLVEHGISVKCIKRPVPCPDTGQDCTEVLRIGFPWWATTEQVDDGIAALTKSLGEVLAQSPAPFADHPAAPGAEPVLSALQSMTAAAPGSEAVAL